MKNKLKKIEIYNRYIAKSLNELVHFKGDKYAWKENAAGKSFVFDLPTGSRAVSVEDINSFQKGILTTTFEIDESIVDACQLREYVVKESSEGQPV